MSIYVLVMVIHVLVMDIQKSDGCTRLVMRIQFQKIGDAEPRFGDGGTIPNFFGDGDTSGVIDIHV